jgi:hypothetical protein
VEDQEVDAVFAWEGELGERAAAFGRVAVEAPVTVTSGKVGTRTVSKLSLVKMWTWRPHLGPPPRPW